MDYLSGKLKESININKQNNKFKQLIKTSTKITTSSQKNRITRNKELKEINRDIMINKNQQITITHKQLLVQSYPKKLQTLQKKSVSQQNLQFKMQTKQKRSNSNIRISSRKSQRSLSIYKKQQQQIYDMKHKIIPTNFSIPIKGPNSSHYDRQNAVLKLSDLIQGINSELLLVVTQSNIKLNADFKKFQQIIKQIKRQNSLQAQLIQVRLSQLKSFAQKYKVKNGTIKVANIIKLSKKKVVSNFQIVTLFDSYKEIIHKNKNIPGVKFYYPDIVKGKILAANKIISLFKVLSTKKYTQKYASLMKKVQIIQKYWRKCLFVKVQRKKILDRINLRISLSGQIQQKFQKSWQILKSYKKVQIHICSLSFQSFKRMTLQRKQQFQNSQINRIFRSFETDTSVIYVSPIQISQDLVKYYQRLFKISSKQFSEKVTFIVPQNIKRLSVYQLTTTNYLLYSPKSLAKIKRLLKFFQTAYIVPSYPSMEFINLSIQLNIPIMSSSQSQSKILSTKIGCQQIFQSVCKDSGLMLRILKSIDSIYSQTQLLNSLAVLIFKNQRVKRWYLKIDDQVCGRGLAYFNVNSISFLKYISGNQTKQQYQQLFSTYQDKQIIKLIKKEIGQKIKSRLKILHKDVYPTYSQYITHFLTRGGIIQASPINNNCQELSVSFYIQPNGDFQILGTYQKIQINSRNASQTIRSPCKVQFDYQTLVRNFYRKLYQKRKMYGYFSVDMVYQIEQKIAYPIGLDCFLNTYTSSLIFTRYLTNGLYKKDINKYVIKQLSQTTENLQLSLNSAVTSGSQQMELYFYYCPKIQLLHLQNLNIFFKKCKFENISFDIKTKTGTLFILLDDLESESIGFLCCQTNPQKLCLQIYHTVQFLSKNYRTKKGKNKKQFDQVGFLRGVVCLQYNNQRIRDSKAPEITLSDFF